MNNVQLLTVICLAKCFYCSNILAILPTPSFSHQIAFRELWKGLSMKGHQVTVVTTDPMNDHSLRNLREINMSRSYDVWNNICSLSEEAHEGLNIWNIHDFFYTVTHKVLHDQIVQPEVQSLINERNKYKFDVVMVEVFFPGLLIFGKIYNCPTIALGTIGGTMQMYHTLGNDVHPVLNSNMNLPYFGELSFGERIMSFLYQFYLNIWENTRCLSMEQFVIDKFFKHVTSASVEELLSSVDLLLINESPFLKGIRAQSPTVINVFGLNYLKPLKPLPQELKEFLDSAEDGFIYFSLGGNVKSKDLNNQTMSNIMNTFRKIPYKVLWKFEANNLPGKPDNVKLIRWAPQQDVLRHPNIKAFVTQGGILSVEEAIYTHVPMVVMPFYGDQLKNARIIENKEIGKFVNHKPRLQAEEFEAALLEVITNDKYKKSITQLANLIQDQPMTGLETAIWWTEYVIRHKGAKQLRNPAADIPLYQYYLLDVLGFLGLVLYIVIRLTIFFVKRTIYFLSRKEKQKAA